ncbi:MAG: sigma-70 family RNA polymerase sigma factor [Oscillospiraceae bacterium]|nr:sigma-70 family RNA polymerase sigma factor [Oscillospiraceae bacterium]
MQDCELTALVEQYADMVLRIAYQHCFNKSDSEDITQEVFLKLLDHIGELPDQRAVKAWLIRVTVNQCKDCNKSAWYRRHTPLEDDGAAVCWQDEELALLDVLKRLRPMQRTMLYMHYYEGYKIREIAEILRLRENTVSSGLHRARKELRRILTEGEDASWRKNIALCSPK